MVQKPATDNTLGHGTGRSKQLKIKIKKKKTPPWRISFQQKQEVWVGARRESAQRCNFSMAQDGPCLWHCPREVVATLLPVWHGLWTGGPAWQGGDPQTCTTLGPSVGTSHMVPALGIY